MLLQASEQAKAQLDPQRFPDPETLKQPLLSSMEAVAPFFKHNTSPENAAGWMSYLQLDELRQAIESDASTTQQGQLAVALRERLIGFQPGLELAPLIQLRQELDRYIAALRFAESERAMDQLQRQLGLLGERANEIGPVPNPEDAAAVAAVVGSLQESAQAPAAVSMIRSLFDEPNAVITLNETLVQAAVSRSVDQSREVRECILGTRLVGLASLHGHVTADLRPSAGAALLTVNLNGTFSSNNRGYNGPVQLHTVGAGEVFASRDLMLNQDGVTMQPAFVSASLSSEIRSIQHPLKIVRRIARKRAAQSKPKADRIAVEKLRREVGEQFVAETNQPENITTGDPLARFRPWMGRLGLPDPTSNWGSTDNSLYIQSKLRRDDQLSSPVPAPPFNASYDLAIQIHESLVDNALTPVLAGRRVRESQLDSLVWMSQTNIQTLPADIESLKEIGLDDIQSIVTEPEEPFEIDFARFRPVIFEARDGRLRVGVRGTRFAQGARELSRAMEITAVYLPSRDEAGNYVLRRDGEIGVDFPGRGRLTLSQTALKSTIRKSFADVFPEVLADQPIPVPQDVPLEAIRGRIYQPSLISAQDGWLTIALHQPVSE